jgi:hypothetical protein
MMLLAKAKRSSLLKGTLGHSGSGGLPAGTIASYRAAFGWWFALS